MADKEFLYCPLKGVIPVVVLGCVDTQAILLGKIVEILILIFESKFLHALCFQDRWTWAMVRVFTIMRALIMIWGNNLKYLPNCGWQRAAACWAPETEMTRFWREQASFVGEVAARVPVQNVTNEFKGLKWAEVQTKASMGLSGGSYSWR